MQGVTASWLNFGQNHFQPENESIYGTNDHL